MRLSDIRPDARPNAIVCLLCEVAEALRDEGAEDLADDADRAAANVAMRFQTNPHTPDRT